MRKNLILIFSIFFLFGCKRRILHSSESIEKKTDQIELSKKGKEVKEKRIVIENKKEIHSGNKDKSPTTVGMTANGGVYEIPVKINGVNMDFIFDTGASGISISEAEVVFLAKQNKIFKEDIIGSIESIDALGNISEGTEIVLREVQIGNRKLENVKASVVHNSIAPILLGQSALSRFGKVTIDYNNQEITFE